MIWEVEGVIQPLANEVDNTNLNIDSSRSAKNSSQTPLPSPNLTFLNFDPNFPNQFHSFLFTNEIQIPSTDLGDEYPDEEGQG